MTLEDEFDQAVARVDGLPSSPPQDVMLELYGLFKQARAGDVRGSRPGRMDLRGRAKYDAWASRKGMSRSEAMRAYIDRAARLR
jgi:diazepam-binding inhibitor (GABA receptor modulator, acyl-CoA-binding protein)